MARPRPLAVAEPSAHVRGSGVGLTSIEGSCSIVTTQLVVGMVCCRSIIKTDSGRFETPVVRPGSGSRGRDSLPGYDDADAASAPAIGYRRGVGGALVALPAHNQRSHLQPSSSIEKKRKTVRMSESHEYYSDYNNDIDDW